MKCKATNSKGLPCGNDAIDGEAYCQVHLKSRTKWYQKITRPGFFVPVLIALLGIAADLLGIWSFRGDWSTKTKLLAGIEFIEGGIELDSSCSLGVCDKQTAGVSFDDAYEPIFHMVVGPNAGDCLALGFSLLNETDELIRNVRAQVSLASDDGTSLQFCDEFEIVYNSLYPGVGMARQFAQMNGMSIASYTVDEIAPRNAQFFTVPIRNSPNLEVILNDTNLQLSGSPTTIRVTHSADNSTQGEISAFLYLSDISDKAQGLVDHTLLHGHHAQYSQAVFSDASHELVNHLKSWVSNRPKYTEFVVGTFVSIGQTDMHISYSVPTDPIEKLVVTARKDGNSLGAMNFEDYLDYKTEICIDVVQNVEGSSYDCMREPVVSIN